MKVNFKLNSITIALFLFLFAIPNVINGQGWERVYESGYINLVDQLPDGNFQLVTRGTGANSPGNQIFIVDELGYVVDNYPFSDYNSYPQLIKTNSGHFLTTEPFNGDLRLIKKDLFGNTLWEYTYENLAGSLKLIIEDSNNDILFVSQLGNISFTIVKMSEDGLILWEQLIETDNSFFRLALGEIPTGYIFSYKENNTDNFPYLMHFDFDGNLQWSKESDENSNTRITEILGLSNSFLTFGQILGECFIDKYDLEGNLEWTTVLDPLDTQVAVELIETTDGGYAALMYGEYEEYDSTQIILSKLDIDGNVEWIQEYGDISLMESCLDFEQTQDGGFIIGGGRAFPDNTSVLYLIKTDPNGNSLTNTISGNVFFDLDPNCEYNNEDPLGGWIVNAIGNQISFYDNADSEGNYTIEVDQGIFEVTATMPSPFWEVCNLPITVDLSEPFSGENVDIPVQADEICPFMTISMYGGEGRLCIESEIYVTVENIGTELAENVTVEIELDPFYEYLDFTGNAILISQNNNLFTFSIGDVDFLEEVQFIIQTMNNCDTDLIGQSVCNTAKVFPDFTCLPTDPLWSGAELELSAECIGNEVIMTIENVGTGDMNNGSNFIVIEDDVIMMNEPFNAIQSGDFISFPRMANGSFQRIETMQVPFHPIGNDPVAFIEGCGVNGSGAFSVGFVNQYPLGDESPFEDIECSSIIAAYDPNAKYAFPIGYQAEHFIEKNTDINYALHFQNVGNAPATKVVLVDYLSENLDPSTIVIGNSSHDYTFDLSGRDRMEFIFNNINLPDSLSDPAGSQGFVEFTIKQQPDLPIGTQIYNEANIYFDFNPPIKTNETMHTIGENFISVDVEDILRPNVAIQVFPNPFNTSTTFEVLENNNLYNEDLEFELFDMIGRKIISRNFNNGSLTLSSDGLSTGTYFYTILNPEGLLNSGKVVVQKK